MLESNLFAMDRVSDLHFLGIWWETAQLNEDGGFIFFRAMWIQSETPHFLETLTLESLAEMAGFQFLNEIAVHIPYESVRTTSRRRQWWLKRVDGDIGRFQGDFEDIDGDDE